MTILSRRDLLTLGTAALAGAAVGPSFSSAEIVEPEKPTPFRYSLNFGTLLGFNLSIEEEIDVAADAGYDAIEPWTRKLDEFQRKGGRLGDLRKRIEDRNLAVAGACAFFVWASDDEQARSKGIEQMKREMDWLREIGGTRIAATASGVTNRRMDDFKVLGERYRTILDIGEEFGVVPQLEIWGAVPTMNCLADVTAIAVHSGHPKAELLLDVYHLYRGGSSFDSLALLNGAAMSCFHMNDYPAGPPRERAADKDRVYPGDGVAPLAMILKTLRGNGFKGFLSFEVFNPDYWATKDPLAVAKTGLVKMKAVE